MKKTIKQTLVYSPKPDITPYELAEIMRLTMFQTYPPELRTAENFTAIFNQLPEGAQRHFQIKD